MLQIAKQKVAFIFSAGDRKITNIPPWSYPDAAAGAVAATSGASAVGIYYLVIRGREV